MGENKKEREIVEEKMSADYGRCLSISKHVATQVSAHRVGLVTVPIGPMIGLMYVYHATVLGRCVCTKHNWQPIVINHYVICMSRELLGENCRTQSHLYCCWP